MFLTIPFMNSEYWFKQGGNSVMKKNMKKIDRLPFGYYNVSYQTVTREWR